MAVNYNAIFITGKESSINIVISNTMVIYHGILTLEKVSIEVNYCGIFITLAAGAQVVGLKLMW